MARLRNGMRPNQDFDPTFDSEGNGGLPGSNFAGDGSQEEAPFKGPGIHEQRGGETPRERPVPHKMPLPGGTAGPGPTTPAPSMPHYPEPQAGSASMSTGAMGGTDQMGMGMGGASAGPVGATSTFTPLGSPAMGALTSSRRSLYGKAGGLLGGGLGAQDTTSNNMSDPISSLIQLLQKRGGGQF